MHYLLVTACVAAVLVLASGSPPSDRVVQGMVSRPRRFRVHAIVSRICKGFACCCCLRAAVPTPPVAYVTPATLKKLTSMNNNTVLLTLYVPHLPRWKNFSMVLDSVNSHFRQPGALPGIQIVKGDCSANPVRARTRALRMVLWTALRCTL